MNGYEFTTPIHDYSFVDRQLSAAATQPASDGMPLLLKPLSRAAVVAALDAVVDDHYADEQADPDGYRDGCDGEYEFVTSEEVDELKEAARKMPGFLVGSYFQRNAACGCLVGNVLAARMTEKGYDVFQDAWALGAPPAYAWQNPNDGLDYIGTYADQVIVDLYRETHGEIPTSHHVIPIKD